MIWAWGVRRPSDLVHQFGSSPGSSLLVFNTFASFLQCGRAQMQTRGLAEVASCSGLRSTMRTCFDRPQETMSLVD